MVLRRVKGHWWVRQEGGWCAREHLSVVLDAVSAHIEAVLLGSGVEVLPPGCCDDRWASFSQDLSSELGAQLELRGGSLQAGYLSLQI